MNNEMRKANIFVQSEYAGILCETDEGYTFTYDSDYLTKESALAVSLTLPLQESPYFSPVLFPFFDGLIPGFRKSFPCIYPRKVLRVSRSLITLPDIY